jgi:hypothetical protein
MRVKKKFLINLIFVLIIDFVILSFFVAALLYQFAIAMYVNVEIFVAFLFQEKY